MHDEKAIFFDGWDGLAQVAVVAPLIYLIVVAAIRVSGKRTTGQMNNFDWIVTVAIGSIMASGIVIEKVALSEAALAIGLLIGMQWVLTTLVLKSERIARIVKSPPRLLVDEGEMQRGAMRNERVSEDEIRAALRQAGVPSMTDVRWLSLENDGTFAVVTRQGADDATGHRPGAPGDVIEELLEAS